MNGEKRGCAPCQISSTSQEAGPMTGSSSTIPSKRRMPRSEEHTSELQSLMRISYAVFCLKKKKRKHGNGDVNWCVKDRTHTRLTSHRASAISIPTSV